MNNKQKPFIVTSHKTNRIWFYCTLAIALIFSGIAIFIKSEAWIMALSFLVLALLGFIQMSNKKPIIIIYYDGIWATQTELIYWSDISSLSTISDYLSEINHTHTIELVISDNKIKIGFTISDQSMYEIRNAIHFFSAGHDIIDKGHTTLPENHIDY